MKKAFSIVILAVAAILLCGTAAADIVDYSTTGTFNCNGASSCADSGGSSSVTIGTGANTFTLAFTGLSGVSIGTPTTSALGTVNVSTTGTGGTISNSPTFTLEISQTSPSAGSGTLVSAITGTIQFNSSSGQLVFLLNGTSVTIGSVTYDLLHTVDGNGLAIIKLPAPSSCGSDCSSRNLTIEADVSSSSTAVPEPASMTLLGSGFLGAASYLRRRIRKS